MHRHSPNTLSTTHYMPMSIGMLIGGGLSVLGTPILVVILLAGLTAAYTLGWGQAMNPHDVTK